jgi:hypothetical protein
MSCSLIAIYLVLLGNLPFYPHAIGASNDAHFMQKISFSHPLSPQLRSSVAYLAPLSADVGRGKDKILLIS